MVVEYKGVPDTLPDNDLSYFSLLEGVLSSIDAYAQLTVVRGSGAYHFRIIPSAGPLINSLVGEINRLHNLMSLQVAFSKSIKSSSVISYTISL